MEKIETFEKISIALGCAVGLPRLPGPGRVTPSGRAGVLGGTLGPLPSSVGPTLSPSRASRGLGWAFKK